MKYSFSLFTQIKERFRGSIQENYSEDWKNNLLSLYIIRKGDGICLFSHHFQLGSISHIETQLVGMGFSALARMMREIVDSSARLAMIDLGKKKVLIDERESIMVVLVTITDSPFLREKLEEFSDHFEKVFELQQQIDLETCVCLENYALTSELVSMVFQDRYTSVLEIIPVLFKSIQKRRSIFPDQDRKSNLESSQRNLKEITKISTEHESIVIKEP
ncbi:MAG: hypothetical protein ACXAC8_11065 [Candidatus Hodarchaeales archaeon]|jgi:hypothetical protein